MTSQYEDTLSISDHISSLHWDTRLLGSSSLFLVIVPGSQTLTRCQSWCQTICINSVFIIITSHCLLIVLVLSLSLLSLLPPATLWPHQPLLERQKHWLQYLIGLLSYHVGAGEWYNDIINVSISPVSFSSAQLLTDQQFTFLPLTHLPSSRDEVVQ